MFKNANDQYKKYPTNQTHSMEIDRLKHNQNLYIELAEL